MKCSVVKDSNSSSIFSQEIGQVMTLHNTTETTTEPLVLFSNDKPEGLAIMDGSSDNEDPKTSQTNTFVFFPIQEEDDTLYNYKEPFSTVGNSLPESLLSTTSLCDTDDECSIMLPISSSFCDSSSTSTATSPLPTLVGSSNNNDDEDTTTYNSSTSSDGKSNETVVQGKRKNRKPRFDNMWNIRYKELLGFLSETGHTNVPHTYPKNPPLARWVKHQRRQYKLWEQAQQQVASSAGSSRKKNRRCAITVERRNLLDSIGFVWDSHDLTWHRTFEKLKDFRRRHGHCNVPSNYKTDKLGMWVKGQRRQYKLYQDGKPSAMFPERIRELEEAGFEWKLRKRKSTGPAEKRSVDKNPSENKLKDTCNDEETVKGRTGSCFVKNDLDIKAINGEVV